MSIDQGGPKRYALGIDFGTSNTVAVARWPDGRARPILVDGSPLLPSAVFADAKGNLLVGRDAVHSARVDPARFEPNPKRRIDDGLVLLGKREFETVELITAVLARVTEEWHRAVGPYRPQTTLTCPASWGSTRRTLLAEAAARAGLEGARLVAEPVAAATYFAEILGRDVPIGSVVMVHDFGAGTFDASLVARTAEGFEVLAVDGLDDVGGLDIDAAVVEHLRTDSWQPLMEPATVEQRRARRQLWDDVRIAKERLSRAQSADFVVPLLDVEAHLTREELETVARPVLDRTVEITKNLLRWADLPDGQLAGVFLVGGASRIPLVATLLHRELGDPPVVIEQPEMVVAEGSILAGAALLATEPAAPGPTELLRLPSKPLPAGSTPASATPVAATPTSAASISAGAAVAGVGSKDRTSVTRPVQVRPSAELAAASAAAQADGVTVVTGPAEADTVMTPRPGDAGTVVTARLGDADTVVTALVRDDGVTAMPGDPGPLLVGGDAGATAMPDDSDTAVTGVPRESATVVTAAPGDSETVVTAAPGDSHAEGSDAEGSGAGVTKPPGEPAGVVTGPAGESATVVTALPAEPATVVTAAPDEFATVVTGRDFARGSQEDSAEPSAGGPAADRAEAQPMPGPAEQAVAARADEQAVTGRAVKQAVADPAEEQGVARRAEEHGVARRVEEHGVARRVEEQGVARLAEGQGGAGLSEGRIHSRDEVLGTVRLPGAPSQPEKRAGGGAEPGANTAAQMRPAVDPWPDAAPATWQPDPEATAATSSPPESGWTPVPPRRAGSAPRGKRPPMPVVAHARPISSVPAPAARPVRPVRARAVAAAPRVQPEPARPRKRRRGARFLRGVQILLSVLAMLLIPLAALVISYGYGNREPLEEDAVNVFKDLAKMLGLL